MKYLAFLLLLVACSKNDPTPAPAPDFTGTWSGSSANYAADITIAKGTDGISPYTATGTFKINGVLYNIVGSSSQVDGQAQILSNGSYVMVKSYTLRLNSNVNIGWNVNLYLLNLYQTDSNHLHVGGEYDGVQQKTVNDPFDLTRK